MSHSTLHRFEQGGRRFALDTETCFCFECDEISWSVLDLYPHTPVNRIFHLLRGSHPENEVEEVIGELEWLRSTQSILPLAGQKEQLKAFELSPDLAEVEVRIPAEDAGRTDRLVSGAAGLLLGRSGAKKDLTLRLVAAGAPPDPGALSESVGRAFRDARLAGKSLRVVVEAPANPSGRDATALAGHTVAVVLSFRAPESVGEGLRAFSNILEKPLAKIAARAGGAPGVVLTPGNAAFSDGIAHLRSAGFQEIHLDLPGAYARDPALDPASVLAGMHTAAVYYAQQLLAGNYFQLEPIAAAFHQIYEGTPKPRSDPSGSHLLAVDERGDVYPSRYFVGRAEYRLGNLDAGHIDEDRRGAFDDLGSLTTSPCSQCWARNLCGGGHSAIHQARGGGIRTPEPVWCEHQRDWFASAIAAFNLLSAEGVNFARLYQNLQPSNKPTLWQAAKAAVTMKVGVRPIEEADAPLLTRWENWSDAVYFLGNEYGMFLATQYDREMDSLHPRGIEQELVVVSRQGAPIGLLKLRPDARFSLARAWVYLHDPKGYTDSGLRRSFARILTEAAGQGTFKTLVAAAGPRDTGLGDFLLALGFERAGTEREALFLHDGYHDVDVYALRMA